MAEEEPESRSYEMEIKALAKKTAALPPRLRVEVTRCLMAIITALIDLGSRLLGIPPKKRGRRRSSRRPTSRTAQRRPPRK